MAALLVCGPDAVLSHESAGNLWGIVLPQAGAPVVVTTKRDLRGRYSGVQIHRAAVLGSDERGRLDDLSLTTPARTLLDLAGILDSRGLELALARADRQRLLDRDEVGMLLARYPRRPGIARLRALLTESTSPALTRSEAEEHFLSLIRRAGLRPPEMNVLVRGFEVDALWPAERLIVEIDGLAFHSSAASFERDRQRDGILASAGFRVIRVTWRQITREPEALLVRLAQALVRGESSYR